MSIRTEPAEATAVPAPDEKILEFDDLQVGYGRSIVLHGVSGSVAADGVSACWTKVGTVVVMSSPTAQTGALSNALTSWLLPCLNSPATRTRISGVSARARL